MEYFPKLNKAWQEGINAEVQDSDGGEHPEIASAFRESYAKYLSEIKIARRPLKEDLADVGESYGDFSAGWKAALDRLTKDNSALISSWVREHGEGTDYSDLEGNEYSVYIVKESDLIV